MDNRIRHRLTATDDEVDTGELIRRLAKARLNNDHNRDVDDHASNKAQDDVLGISEARTDTTTALLNTDFASMSRNRDVSESTMLIGGNVPTTPERRPISGSSLDLISGFQDDEDYDETDEDQKQMNLEIDLDQFNYLLTKLPASITVTHFKHILTSYIDSLVRHNINISSDKFIITIFNQLRHEDFKLSDNPKMIKIIDVFIHNPSNEAMKLSNFLYFTRMHNKKKFFIKLWLIKSRKLIEIKKSYAVWEKYLIKKQFNKWTLKYDIYQNDLASNALIFNDVKKILKFYDIWRFKLDKVKNLNEIVDLHQESKFFNRWTDKITDDYSTARTFDSKNLLQRFFKAWVLRSKAKSQSLDSSRLNLFFRKWKLKSDKIQRLKRDSQDLELVLHGGYFFTKWKDLTFEDLERVGELMDKYKSSVLTKYIKTWQKALLRKSVENQVIQSRNKILREFFLKFWLQRNKEIKILTKFQDEEARKAKKVIFHKWRSTIEINKKISNFREENIRKRFLKIWKLQAMQKIYQENNRFNDLAVSNHFAAWLRKSKLERSLKEFTISIMKTRFATWTREYQHYQSLVELSDEANSTFVKLRFLQNWKGQYKFIQLDLGKKVDLFQKKRAFGKLKSKIGKINKMKEVAQDHFDNESSLLIKANYFRKWHSHYEYSIEVKLSNKLEIFRVERNIEIRNVYFTKWKARNDSYSNQLTLYTQDFLKRSVLPKFLQIWKSRLDYIKAMETQSNDMNNINLLSSGFNKLQMKLAYIQKLEQISTIHQQDRDLKSIMEILNLWSLRLLKQKRDNENIKSFRNRWNRAHLRAILLLWKGKLIDSTGRYQDLEAMEYSPTIFKTKNVMQLHQTPKKAIGDPSNNFTVTASGGASIPGSERIKRERYEALRSRYGQVKYAIPSPLKFNNQNTATKTPLPISSNFDSLTALPDISTRSSKKLKFVGKPRDLRATSDYNELIPKPNTDDQPNDDEFDEPISSPIISHKNLFNFASNRKSIGSDRSSTYRSSGLF